MSEPRDIEHGTMAGYRRGCKCERCRKANRDRMRAWRDRNHAVSREEAEVVEIARDLDPLAPMPALSREKPAGDVELALTEDLTELVGEPPWKRTLGAVALLNARMLDQAPDIDRLDLLSPIQLRLIEELKLLRAVSSTGPSMAEQAAQLLEDLQRGGA